MENTRLKVTSLSPNTPMINCQAKSPRTRKGPRHGLAVGRHGSVTNPAGNQVGDAGEGVDYRHRNDAASRHIDGGDYYRGRDYGGRHDRRCYHRSRNHRGDRGGDYYWGSNYRGNDYAAAEEHRGIGAAHGGGGEGGDRQGTNRESLE
jgi:hypothetical protein